LFDYLVYLEDCSLYFIIIIVPSSLNIVKIRLNLASHLFDHMFNLLHVPFIYTLSNLNINKNQAKQHPCYYNCESHEIVENIFGTITIKCKQNPKCKEYSDVALVASKLLSINKVLLLQTANKMLPYLNILVHVFIFGQIKHYND